MRRQFFDLSKYHISGTLGIENFIFFLLDNNWRLFTEVGDNFNESHRDSQQGDQIKHG